MRSKIFVAGLFLIGAGNFVSGSHDLYSLGSRSAGMANTTVMFPHFWSVHHNQAGLACINKTILGFHHENKFIVPEYGLQALAFTLPTREGTLAFSVSYFGYSQYNESRFGLAFGRKFSDKIYAGVQVDYLNTFIGEGYGNAGTVTCEGGIILLPYDHLYLGAHVFNPVRSTIKAYTDEPIPTIFRIGAGYQFPRVFIATEAEKELDASPNYKTGLEYVLRENFFLRTGLSSNPFTQTFGLGYSIKSFLVDLAFTHHPVLGFTPHFSVQVSF
jgi:hypothetical protein